MDNLFQKIKQALDGINQADGSFFCLCPAHDDRDPSLHVTEQDGKLLIHCHAGCEQKAVIEALRAQDLWTEAPNHTPHLKPRTSNSQQRTAKKIPLGIPKDWKKQDKDGNLIETRVYADHWPYKDEHGNVLGYVVRYDGKAQAGKKTPKDIIPFFYHKHSKDKWSPGAPKNPRPLFALNLIFKAPKNITIWITEGEKCARALQQHRRLTTTSLGGTGAARYADWSRLAGRTVRIWPDNDKPGQKYANEVRTCLEGLMPPPTIEVLDVSKLNLQPKEDAYDWLQKHDPDELTNIPLVRQKAKIRSVSLSELLEIAFPPEELILAPWLPTQGICMIHARAGVGKTFLAIGIAFAVAAGSKFLKWEAPTPRGVLYVDGEMAGDDIKKRYERMVVEHGFCLPGKTLNIITPDINDGLLPDIGTPEGQKIIEEQVTDDIDLLIIDNLSCLQRTGIENEAGGWTKMQEWLLRLKSKGKAVLLIHHAGKGGAQRGTSKREDFLNSMITLKRNPLYEYEEGAKFEVHYEKARKVYGAEARPFEAQLDPVDGIWTTKDLKVATYDQVVVLMKEGISQIDIAKSLGKSKGLISQLVKKAKEKGDL